MGSLFLFRIVYPCHLLSLILPFTKMQSRFLEPSCWLTKQEISKQACECLANLNETDEKCFVIVFQASDIV